MRLTHHIGRAVRRLLPTRIRPWLFQLLEDSWLLRVLHGEIRVIEAELEQSGGQRWRGFADPSRTRNMSERVVEIPWVVSRVGPCPRLLDVGSAFAWRAYIRALTARPVGELIGVDLSSRAVPGMAMTQADVRELPFSDASFHMITCVSTLEHIGLDNDRYGTGRPDGGAGDRAALRELRRVMRSDGQILITVPVGSPGHYGWFRQYDLEQWTDLLEEASLVERERTAYSLTEAGWQPCPNGAFPHGTYQQDGAPAATGVLCAVLVRGPEQGAGTPASEGGGFRSPAT